MGKTDLQQKREMYWTSIQNEKGDLIRRALRSGAVQLSTTNDDGMTGLQYAASLGKERSVAAILDFGHSARGPAISINLTDDLLGKSALMFACEKGALGCVKLLIEAGADKNIKDEDGKTARDYAVNGKFAKLVEFIDFGEKEEEEEEEVGEDGETSTQRSRDKKKAIKEQAEKARLAAIAAAAAASGGAAAAQDEKKEGGGEGDNLAPLAVDWSAVPVWEELKTHLATGRQDVTLNKIDLGASDSVDKALWRCTSITRLQLRMPEGNLTSLPEELGALTQLTTLILSKNALTALPASFSRLGRNLKVLEIANNKLTALPEGLSNLEVLDASFNNLSSVESISHVTTLLSINLDSNKLTGALPLCYSGLRRLATLSAAQNQLSSMHWGVGFLTNLTTLNLADNKIANIPTEFSDLSEKKLKTVFLDNNPLKDPRAKKILEKGKQPVKELIAHVKKVNAPRQTEDGTAKAGAGGGGSDDSDEDEDEEKEEGSGEENEDDDDAPAAAASSSGGGKKRGGGGGKKKGRR